MNEGDNVKQNICPNKKCDKSVPEGSTISDNKSDIFLFMFIKIERHIRFQLKMQGDI